MFGKKLSVGKKEMEHIKSLKKTVKKLRRILGRIGIKLYAGAKQKRQ